MTLIKRFDAKFDQKADNDCWPWTAATSKGYGQIGYKGKLIYAHRLAWVFKNGAIPKGKHILHKCDNTKCVNPHHLFLGTHSDNMKDMEKKGRGRTGRRKLTEKQVSQIHC